MNTPFVWFGPAHLAALALVAVAPLLLVLGLRRWPGARPFWRWGMLGLLLAYGARIYAFRWSTLSWADCLPLHLCDLEMVLLACALAWPRARLGGLVYYWGMAGAIPAMLSPDLKSGYPSVWFFIFFLGHGVIVLAVTTVLLLQAEPPGPARRAFLALLAYVAAVGSLDALTGWNYGYLRQPPAGHTVVDHFGAWPVYILTALGVAGLLFALLEVPFRKN